MKMHAKSALTGSSPDPYLEIHLAVNLNFQVHLPSILAYDIFPKRNDREVRC